MSVPPAKELVELDVFCARHVMGWDTDAMVKMSDGIYNRFGPAGASMLSKWSPTTDPAAAMMVLEKCAQLLLTQDKEETVSIGCDDPHWVVEKTNCTPNLRVEAPTLPLAIARFARKLFEK